MNFFKKIAKTIQKLIPFLKKVKPHFKPVSFKDLEPQVIPITKELDDEIINIFEKTDKPRIKKVTEKQQRLIDKKSELYNLPKSDQEFKTLQKLNTQLELLKSNFKLQSRIKFKRLAVPDDLLLKLKEELPDIVETENINEIVLKRQQTLNKLRKEELQTIKLLKKQLLSLSLVELHKKREEQRKEKERIAHEEQLDKQCNIILNDANEYLKTFNFDQSIKLIKDALKLRPERSEEINNLIRSTKNKKSEYQIVKAKFDQIIKQAENRFHKHHYQEAIDLYISAKSCNIDNYYCSRRIEDCKYQIERKLQLEEEEKQRVKEEQERISKYKKDAEEILEILNHNGITQFYHFTDNANINSIIQNNGLFSWEYCEKHNIDIPLPGGSSFSRRLDKSYGLQNFVRLSYVKEHPMKYVAKNESRIFSPVDLKINIEVAKLKQTKFTDKNATKRGHTIGIDAKYLKDNVKFSVFKKRKHFDLDESDKPYFQAEVMVKEHVPLEYIMNFIKP